MNAPKILQRILPDFLKSPVAPGSGLKPGHDVGHVLQDRAFGNPGPVEQDHRQTQVPGRDQLGLGPAAARILGDDHIDAVILQKRPVACHCKGPSGNHHLGVRQGERFGRWIDQTQQEMMRAGLGKSRKVLAADGKKHPLGSDSKGSDSAGQVGGMGPAVAGDRRPWRPLEGDQGNACCSAGPDRVAAHLRREWVGRVDHLGDAFRPKIIDQPLDATKPADSDWQGLRDRCFGPARIGIDRRDARRGQRAGQLRGFGCSAKKKDARHG